MTGIVSIQDIQEFYNNVIQPPSPKEFSITFSAGKLNIRNLDITESQINANLYNNDRGPWSFSLIEIDQNNKTLKISWSPARPLQKR